MPVIGNISNGKTSLINAFMGKDICPVKNDITTTSALFIRHINNLNEPRLYKLSPIKNLNNNFLSHFLADCNTALFDLNDYISADFRNNRHLCSCNKAKVF